MLWLLSIDCKGHAVVHGPFDSCDERTKFADKYLVDEQEDISELIEINGDFEFLT